MSSLIAEALAGRQVGAGSLWWRRGLFFLNALALASVGLTGGTSAWAWIALLAVHQVVLIGLFLPNSPWLGPILSRLPTEEKIVWLTIDDGPSTDTAALADFLGSQHIPATFFFQGNRLEAHSAAFPALRRHGHTVANHSQSHNLAWFWAFPPARLRREIDAFAEQARRHRLPLIPAFRCPAGLKNLFLHGILRQRGLTLTGWTIRAYDGVHCDAAKSLRHVISCLCPGAIILVHEGKTDARGSAASLAFISELVTAIRAAGYTFAPAPPASTSNK